MEFKLGEAGNNNSRGRPKGKSLAKYLMEMISDNDKATGRPIKALLAEKAISMALDEKTSAKDFINIFEHFLDRESGKPVNTNLNAEVQYNPFADIDTAKLEAMKAKMLEITKDETKP